MTNQSISKQRCTCQVLGCNEKYHAHGYCSRHSAQIYYYGKIFKRTIFDSNEIIVKGDTAEIVLYKYNKEIARALIDSIDVNKIKGYKWYLSKNGYVCSRKNGKIVYLHKLLGLHEYTDHVYRNKLDNRKSMLRECSPSQNLCNKERPKNNTSGYKGVSWSKVVGKWHSYIQKNGKRYHLGYYSNKIEAARAYDIACIKLHGEFACPNK